MAIHRSFLESVKVSGDDVKALTRKLTHARGSKAANEAAANGKKLVSTFAKNGAVAIKLTPGKTAGMESALAFELRELRTGAAFTR